MKKEKLAQQLPWEPWEVAGGQHGHWEERRNFPCLKGRGFGRQHVAAGGESHLLMSSDTTHRLVSEVVNIPPTLILPARLRGFPELVFQRTVCKSSHNREACFFIPQNILFQNSNEDTVITESL